MNLKEIILNNWKAKIMSFVLATLLWLALKEIIEPGTIDQIKSGTMTFPPPAGDFHS